MTPRRLSPAPLPATDPATALARRGVLLGGPALLLAGCGLLPDGAPQDAPAGGDTSSAPTGGAEESAAPDGTTAVVEFDVVEVSDEVTAGGLMTRLESSEALVHPFAKATVLATTLLDSLTAEQYTALTGEDAPPAEDSESGGEAQPATTILPGQRKQFLLTAWESTDSAWMPAPTQTSTSLSLTHQGNEANYLDAVREGDTERSGSVLAIVDIEPEPSAVALRAETVDGIQELSLVDGSVLTTPAPRLYDRGLEVTVSDATVLETEIPERWANDVIRLRGTVEEAYLSPFVHAGLEYGGRLGWAGEGEIHLVVPFLWDHDFTSEITDRTEVVLVLPDGTELKPAQDQDRIFFRAPHVVTFTVPASLETATVKIMPRFTSILYEDFEQVEDPVTATLTLA